MDQRALVRAAVAGGTILAIVSSGCGSSSQPVVVMDDQEDTDAGTSGPQYGVDAGSSSENPDEDPVMPEEFVVTLVPDGGSGMQRVNFAVPLARGEITEASSIRIVAAGVELPAARRALASHPDGSLRSIQVQVDVDVSATTALTVQLGVPGATGPTLVPVSSTLTGTGSNVHPRVWVRLPADVLVRSGVAGPVVPRAELTGSTLDAWVTFCDYDRWDTDAFLVNAASSRDVWLYDRVTAMYRGYASSGDLVPLRSAYREAEIYRAGMSISNGVTTGLAVPNADTDLKYHYSQGMALHYLLTGDDRHREAAEAVSARVAGMWNPAYNGGSAFWTERHAGFALLAHEWALAVTDDKAAAIGARAETTVAAILAVQATYPTGYTDPNARCFAHSAGAHGETFGTWGCSPWMSAILADALDAHARRVGGTRAAQVRTSLAQLGRMIARDGRDGSGKPYYWLGIGSAADEIDDYDEHWGEAAYVLAMAWDATGRSEASLKQAADSLVTSFRQRGEIGHVRSFNWQCRSAVMAPAYLK